MRGRDLLHPLPLAAVALLVLNDHVLKASAWAPPALTGKLSDFAGLFFFPILLFTLVGVRRAWVAVAAAALTAVVFVAIKLDVRANALAAWVLGSCALDPTDLIALPMAGLAALFCIRPRHAREGRRWARTAAMVVASLASVATSRAYRPPCPAVPKGEAHRSIDTLCARTPGATVTTAANEVSITIDLTPNEPGCAMPLKGLAIDQQPRPDVSARTVIKVPLAPLQQGTRLQLHTALPYPAACESLRLGFLLEGAIVDVPIVACGPRGAP